MLKLKYLSHSCFVLNDGTSKLIIDPFISGNPTVNYTEDDLDVQYVILTHAHGDHLGDGINIAKRNNALIIATNELANYVSSQGCNAHNMHTGGGYNFPFGRVKFTIAHHGSSLNDGTNLGSASGVIVKMSGRTIYHAGDTGLFLDMKLIGEIDKIDVALLPIGDNFTMGINDAVKAVEFVNPGLAIPMHYNTFGLIKADPQEFADKVAGIRKRAKVMEFGEEITL